MKILLLVIVTAAFLFACGSEQPTGSALKKSDVVIRGKVKLNITRYLKKHGKTNSTEYLLRYRHAFSNAVLGGALVQAAGAGDTKLVKVLIMANTPVERVEDSENFGGEALSAAIDGGKSRKIIKSLVRAGADPNSLIYADGEVSYSPVEAAAKQGRRKVVRDFIKAGITVTDDNIGGRALEAAARAGNWKIVKDLIEAGATATITVEIADEGDKKWVRTLLDLLKNKDNKPKPDVSDEG